MKKYILTVTLLLLMASPAFGEATAMIFGAINHNGVAVPGATVTIIGEATYTSRSVVTNEHGIYIIDDLKADEYIIHAIGNPEASYKTAVRNILLRNGIHKEINFELEKR